MQSRWLSALIIAPMLAQAQSSKTKPTAAPPPPASAPAPAASAGAPVSGAVGVVGDSIHGGPLVGAVVSLVGTDRKGTTDSTGKFRIDSRFSRVSYATIRAAKFALFEELSKIVVL